MEAVKELQRKHTVLNTAKFDLSFYMSDIKEINEKSLAGFVIPGISQGDVEAFGRLLEESFASYKKEAIDAGGFSTKLQVTVVLKD